MRENPRRGLARQDRNTPRVFHRILAVIPAEGAGLRPANESRNPVINSPYGQGCGKTLWLVSRQRAEIVRRNAKDASGRARTPMRAGYCISIVVRCRRRAWRRSGQQLRAHLATWGKSVRSNQPRTSDLEVSSLFRSIGADDHEPPRCFPLLLRNSCHPCADQPWKVVARRWQRYSDEFRDVDLDTVLDPAFRGIEQRICDSAVAASSNLLMRDGGEPSAFCGFCVRLPRRGSGKGRSGSSRHADATSSPTNVCNRQKRTYER
jgi:hypothetical protein